MPEVAITKKTSETPAIAQPGDLFRPLIPFGRTFGMNPFALMREFTNELDQFFRGNGGLTQAGAWVPTIDVQRDNGTLTVSAELPGLKKEDVKIEVSNDALSIEGERKRECKEEREGYSHWERNYGHFYRSIPLPEGAKTDQVKAELKDGVLKVTLPVAEAAAKKSKQIPISS